MNKEQLIDTDLRLNPTQSEELAAFKSLAKGVSHPFPISELSAMSQIIKSAQEISGRLNGPIGIIQGMAKARDAQLSTTKMLSNDVAQFKVMPPDLFRPFEIDDSGIKIQAENLAKQSVAADAVIESSQYLNLILENQSSLTKLNKELVSVVKETQKKTADSEKRSTKREYVIISLAICSIITTIIMALVPMYINYQGSVDHVVNLKTTTKKTLDFLGPSFLEEKLYTPMRE